MTPYELGFGILVLALGSTVNAAFPERRWLSFLCLSLSAFGITGLASAGTAYSQFFVVSPQILILFATAVFFCNPKQRFVLAAAGIVLLLGFVFSETWTENYLDKTLGQFALFAALILLPNLIFKVSEEALDKVDMLVSLQQFWLRIALLAWCRENSVNLKHYDIFASYIEIGTLVIGGVFLARLLFARSTWMLTAKSVMSGILFLSALTMDQSEMKILLIWVLVVSLIDILPVLKEAKLLKRMNLGGFGGAVFWGMALFVVTAPMEPAFRLGWAFLISIVSFSAFVLPIPSVDGSKTSSSKQIVALMFFGLLLQAAFFAVVLFWPEIKSLGV